MDTDTFIKSFDYLRDQWCERRELRPLRHILNGRASLNGLTDGYEECVCALRTIRAEYRDSLSSEEFDAVIDLIHAIESALSQNDS